MKGGDIPMPRLHLLIVTLAAASVSLACRGKDTPSAKAPAPAAVAHPVTEASLTTVILTPDAVKRLGIETGKTAQETVSRLRSAGGEVMAPPGGAVTVTAPAAGTLQATEGGVPRPGSRVERGQAIFTLFAVQPPDRNVRLEADRDLAGAEAELTMATQRVQRLERLLADGATSVRAVEEARAQRTVAEANAAAARARLAEFRNSPSGTAGSIQVRSPISGVLQSIAAAPNQTVAASAPLFEVVQTDSLWVRVQVFVGERNALDTTKPVTVTNLGGAKGPALVATPVAGPPSANPATATTDLFYSLQSGGGLRPGERVSVQLPLAGSEQALVVPTAAIVYDMNGGSWVYERTGDTTFVRRRIEIRAQIGDRTAIARGIDAGKEVVTAGAAELFGTEFGAGK
jgi:RND family efflux transporter MFP subunit